MTVNKDTTGSDDISETLGLGESGKGRRRGWRKILLGLIVIVALAAGYFYLRGGDSANSLQYVTQDLTRGALTQTVTATGTVEPTSQVEISSEQSGTVDAVMVDYNDKVEAGQVLAMLDTAKLQAQVDNATASLAVSEARLQEAEATLAEAERAYDRALTLTEQAFVSKASQETAEANKRRAEAGIAIAKANIEVARATLTTARTNLEKATIRSPIDGVVMNRDVDPGQTVAASLQAPVLFTLAEDLTSMQLEVDIDEADIGQVKHGQKAKFTVEAYRDREFPAEVSAVRIAPQELNGVVTYTGVLSLDNTDMALLPGMTATADIIVQHIDDALLIPNAALRFAPPQAAAKRTGGRSGLLSFLMPRPPSGANVARVDDSADGARAVYVLKDGVPQRMRIIAGASDGNFTQVLRSKLSEGDAVIVDQKSSN